MTNLDSIFKSKDITLPTKVRLVKSMVFPVVMYGCESWTMYFGTSLLAGLRPQTLVTALRRGIREVGSELQQTMTREWGVFTWRKRDFWGSNISEYLSHL